MDPDMDIPLPEELELLEANSHFDDEYLDYPSPQPFPSPPHSPADTPATNRNKRPRSDDETDQEKRSKVLHNDEEVKGDLLHYSPEPSAPPLEDSGGVAEKEVQEKFVSRYASEIDGDFIPVTAPSGGHRVYAKICRVEGVEREKRLDVKQSNGLITEPFNVLLQSMEQEAFTKALQASSGEQSDAIHPEMEGVHEKLWVDKYAPNSFTELLSDEQTNREVLLWLKQWDSCVYGSEVRSTGDEVLSALRRHTSVAQHQKPFDSTSTGKNQGHRWSSGNFRRSSYFDNENSKSRGSQELGSTKSRLSGPPEQKILLLCGPPGLGKTTLAHVAAKHCGYRVVEVNASDDRSSSTIEAKILDVVEMNSVTADSRPKCLVIDEIDGALGDGKGAVDVILKMVSAEGKSDIGKENAVKGEQSGRTTLKKRRKTASLLRPVICVCNDLYAPALRPLRQVAKVHIFVQPTVSRVVSRLKYICNKEGMRAGSIALTALAEYTECDIRSCLNTLQFLNKKKKDLNMLEISSQVVGQKNMSKSVYEIWKEIFQKRKIKQERTPNTSCGRTSNEFDLLYSLLSNRGDYDIVLDGIHENILHLYYHDPVMEKTVKCFNILAISDLMHQYMWRTLQLPLQAYQPFLAISVHRLVSQVQKPNIEWPKSYQRYRTSMIEKVDVLRSWQNKILPHISRHLSIKSFVEDSISPLLHILSPPSLRPVALHLLTEKEKDDLAQLVSVMVSYFITYKNIKPALPGNQGPETAIDASTFSFDPPICDFISFKDYSSGHYVLPLAVKQVLVHEVEKQRILRVTRSVNFMDRENQENISLVEGKYNGAQYTKINSGAAFASDTKSGKDVSNSRHILASGSVVSSSDDGGSSLSNAKIKSPGSSKKSSTGYRNFFDRFRKVGTEDLHNADAAVQKITVSDRDSRPLLFKFNEGFTNAVKRPVRMREFLL